VPHLNVFYAPSYAAAAHAFETTRKAAWIAESLVSDPIPGVELRVPRPLTADEIATVHDPAYVAAVRTGEPRALAESQGFVWDAALWEAVAASNGGIVAAALMALAEGRGAGSLSSGLHHARTERGDGFCTFNGLALAAKAALSAGARAILVVDFDAHFGGGTREILADDERVTLLDVSVDRHDAYAPGPRDFVEAVARAEDYLPTVIRGLSRVLEGASFDLCLYNAGMDPHADCPEGGLWGITAATLAAREALVFDACRVRHIPVAFALAGGYLGERLDRTALVALHRLTIEAAARASA
jgi:acetoin utilization deacetylase AcuC-like enzyme